MRANSGWLDVHTDSPDLLAVGHGLGTPPQVVFLMGDDDDLALAIDATVDATACELRDGFLEEWGGDGREFGPAINAAAIAFRPDDDPARAPAPRGPRLTYVCDTADTFSLRRDDGFTGRVTWLALADLEATDLARLFPSTATDALAASPLRP